MDRRKILLVVAVVVAALGAGLVFVYAQGAEDRAQDKQQTVTVLIATQTVLPGESASDAFNAGKLKSARVPADQALSGSTDDGNEFTDTIALTTIYPGEQLLTEKFGTIDDIEGRPTIPLPEGKTAISVQMTNATRVTSFTQPGSHVAIYYVPKPEDYASIGATDPNQQPGTPGQTDPATPVDPNAVSAGLSFLAGQPACAIEDDVLVLGVGSTSVDQRPATSDEGTETIPAQEDVVEVVYITIAVDAQQAARLVPFQQQQERDPNDPILSFALRNDESDVRNTQGCASFLEAFDTRFALAGATKANG